jgi:hypothetical protein
VKYWKPLLLTLSHLRSLVVKRQKPHATHARFFQRELLYRVGSSQLFDVARRLAEEQPVDGKDYLGLQRHQATDHECWRQRLEQQTLQNGIKREQNEPRIEVVDWWVTVCQFPPVSLEPRARRAASPKDMNNEASVDVTHWRFTVTWVKTCQSRIVSNIALTVYSTVHFFLMVGKLRGNQG